MHDGGVARLCEVARCDLLLPRNYRSSQMNAEAEATNDVFIYLNIL